MHISENAPHSNTLQIHAKLNKIPAQKAIYSIQQTFSSEIQANEKIIVWNQNTHNKKKLALF